MAEINKVIIGIQARSGSTRFPRKVFQEIDGKTILQHVLDNCNKCARYMNKYSSKTGVYVDVAILCPFGDEVVERFKKRVTVIEGPEHEVIDRYKIMAEKFKPDYIVRVTSDCVLLPPFLITKHIKTAVMNEYDYVSNVDPRFRTSPDGYDCEVISKRMLNWTYDNATAAADKEHVTSLIRTVPPSWAKMGVIINNFDFSQIKISLDTPEDLKEITRLYFEIKNKTARAVEMYGEGSVHRT